LGLKRLCQTASENVAQIQNRGAILDAREQIYRTLATGGMLTSGNPDGSAAGYSWAGMMLHHFLEGNGQAVEIRGGHVTFNGAVVGGAPGMDYFIRDPGVRRGIDRFIPPGFPTDEPSIVVPLLHAFIGDHLSLVATEASCTLGGAFVEARFRDVNRYYHITNAPERQTYRGQLLGSELRPYDVGFWAAFGHFSIYADYYATLHPTATGYQADYMARYFIEDRYEWFEGKTTPLPLPGASGSPKIPHEWALSLVEYRRAHVFDFTISWTEEGRLNILRDFSGYTQQPRIFMPPPYGP
jgi:hypothetical protein